MSSMSSAAFSTIQLKPFGSPEGQPRFKTPFTPAPSGGHFMPAGLRKFSTSGCRTLSMSQSSPLAATGVAVPLPFTRLSSPTSFSVDSPSARSCRSCVLARFSRAFSCTTEMMSSRSTPLESAMLIVVALLDFMGSRFECAITPNQLVRRAVVRERCLRILEFWDDALRQHFAEFDAPLIEGVDVPDHTLHEHLVLVERNQLSERRWRKAIEQQRI